MAGKVIVYGFKQAVLGSKVCIMLNSEIVGEVKAYERLEIPVTENCQMTCKCGMNKSKDSVDVKDGMLIEVQITYHRISGKITMDILKENVYDVSNNAKDIREDDSEVKPIYDIKGARGRRLQVFEDKCIISTKVGVGSFLTGNISDGEKTIYYSDVLGVQYKKCNLQLGYLQLETASATMNNKGDNFFNENSFTFDNDVDYQMEEVAQFVKKKVDEAKQKKNAPVVVTGAVSNADELKKFKELLDMGIITQEEFDAKKKQLLGL